MRMNGRSSASIVTLPENDLLRLLAVLVDHAAVELPVAGDRELPDDLLAAGLDRLHRHVAQPSGCSWCRRLASLGGLDTACRQMPALQSIVPPPSGRLLRRKICTFVPGNPLTPSFGSGPSYAARLAYAGGSIRSLAFSISGTVMMPR